MHPEERLLLCCLNLVCLSGRFQPPWPEIYRRHSSDRLSPLREVYYAKLIGRKWASQASG